MLTGKVFYSTRITRMRRINADEFQINFTMYLTTEYPEKTLMKQRNVIKCKTSVISVNPLFSLWLI